MELEGFSMREGGGVFGYVDFDMETLRALGVICGGFVFWIWRLEAYSICEGTNRKQGSSIGALTTISPVWHRV